jgi:hypothetical protein
MKLDQIIATKSDIITNVLRDPKFSPTVPIDLLLSDIVIIYSTGKRWKLVPLKYALYYPAIYDKYYDHNYTKKSKYYVSDITLTVCPYSIASVIYFDRLTPTGEIYKNNMILSRNSNNEHIMSQIEGTIYSRHSGKLIESFIRKTGTKIMLLRNAISKYPDCAYLQLDKVPMVDIDYITNKKFYFPIEHISKKYNPKTIIYGIEYISKDEHIDKKYSAIVSQNLKTNKYNEYFDNIMETLRKKGGIAIPLFWFVWHDFYSESKIMEL